MARKRGKGKGKGKALQQDNNNNNNNNNNNDNNNDVNNNNNDVNNNDNDVNNNDDVKDDRDVTDQLQIAASSSEDEATFHDAASDAEEDASEVEGEEKEEKEEKEEEKEEKEEEKEEEEGAATAGSCADDEETVDAEAEEEKEEEAEAEEAEEEAEKEAAAAAQEELLKEQAAAAEAERKAHEAKVVEARAEAQPEAPRSAASVLDRIASDEPAQQQQSSSGWSSSLSSWGSWGASIVTQVASEVSTAAADTYKDISSEVQELATQSRRQQEVQAQAEVQTVSENLAAPATESSPEEDTAPTSNSGVRASSSDASDAVAAEETVAAEAAAPPGSVFSSFFGTVKAAVADAKIDERMQTIASAAAQAGEVVLTRAEGLAHRAESVGAKVAEGSMDALESMGKTAMTVFAEDTVDDEGGNVVVYRRPYIPFLDESALSKEAMAQTGAGGAVGGEGEPDAPPPVTFDSVFAAAAGEASMAKLEELSTAAMVATKSSALDAVLVERLVPYFATDADDETADEVAEEEEEEETEAVRTDSMFLTLDEAGRSRASQLVADFMVALDETKGASADESMDASEAVARAAFDSTMTWLAKCRVSCMETLAEFSGKSVEELAREAGRALPPAAAADDGEADALVEVDADADAQPLAGGDDALAFAKRTHRMAVFRSEQINALSSAFIVAVRDIAGAAKPRIDDLMATATRLPDSGSLGKATPIDQKEITQTLEVVDAQVTATTTDIYLDSGTGVNAIHDALHQLLPVAKAIAARTNEE